MANPEIKILIPDGDSVKPHSPFVCQEAMKLRDKILRTEDNKHGRTPIGICTRRNGVISGCLVEIKPLETKRTKK